jgi:hypothetical protein
VNPVMLFKLISGDEIIGSVQEPTSQFDLGVTILKPRAVMEIFTERGPAVTFRTLLRGAPDFDEIYLLNTQILWEKEPAKNVEDSYLQAMSPIVLSSGSKPS